MFLTKLSGLHGNAKLARHLAGVMLKHQDVLGGSEENCLRVWFTVNRNAVGARGPARACPSARKPFQLPVHGSTFCSRCLCLTGFYGNHRHGAHEIIMIWPKIQNKRNATPSEFLSPSLWKQVFFNLPLRLLFITMQNVEIWVNSYQLLKSV